MDMENTISILADLSGPLQYQMAVLVTALTLAIVLEKISKIRSQS
jgi:hypothetical protein